MQPVPLSCDGCWAWMKSVMFGWVFQGIYNELTGLAESHSRSQNVIPEDLSTTTVSPLD